VAGILKGDYGLISRSLKDVIIEPTRSVLIPGYYEVKEAALNAGVLGSGISGSGPSIFALSKSNAIAKEAGREMKHVFDAIGLGNNVFISEIKPGGPIIMDES
jgi:homoserine kinase